MATNGDILRQWVRSEVLGLNGVASNTDVYNAIQAAAERLAGGDWGQTAIPDPETSKARPAPPQGDSQAVL